MGFNVKARNQDAIICNSLSSIFLNSKEQKFMHCTIIAIASNMCQKHLRLFRDILSKDDIVTLNKVNFKLCSKLTMSHVYAKAKGSGECFMSRLNP